MNRVNREATRATHLEVTSREQVHFYTGLYVSERSNAVTLSTAGILRSAYEFKHSGHLFCDGLDCDILLLFARLVPKHAITENRWRPAPFAICSASSNEGRRNDGQRDDACNSCPEKVHGDAPLGSRSQYDCRLQNKQFFSSVQWHFTKRTWVWIVSVGPQAA